jgi:hypothetical protein
MNVDAPQLSTPSWRVSSPKTRRWGILDLRCKTAQSEPRSSQKNPPQVFAGARDPLQRRARDSPGALFATTVSARNYTTKANPAKTCDLWVTAGCVWLFGVTWQ